MPTKKRQERLIEEAEKRAGWAVGFQDEVWWSRLTHPNLHSWAEDAPLKLVEQEYEKDDPDPKAFACYGIDLRDEKNRRSLDTFCRRQSQKQSHDRLHAVDVEQNSRAGHSSTRYVLGSCFLA